MPCPRALASLILVLALAATSLIVPRTVASSQEAARDAAAPLRGHSVLLAGDLRADVAVLRRAYETLHPGLYRYNTRAEMDEAFGALEAEFQRDRTLADAYLAFSVYAAKLRCGHSYANFYNQRKDVQDALFRAGRVPFHFRWLGHRMVVTRSFASEPRIRAGTEVLSINGVPVDAVLRRLMTVARADGGNDAKRRSDLEVQGANRWEAFDIFFPLLFPSASPRMALRVLTAPGERVTALEVDPLTYEQRLATMATSRDPSGGEDAPAWDLRFLDVRTACLRMPSWALYDRKWDWKAFLEQSFDRVVGQKARDLVIDLRENEGGLGVGDDLLSHLIASDLPAEPVTRRVRYRRVPDDLVPYLDTWDRSFLDWGASAVEPSAGFFRLKSTTTTRAEVSSSPGRRGSRAGCGCWSAPRTARRPSSSPRPCSGTAWAPWSASRPAVTSAASTGERSSSFASPAPASSSTCRSSASSPTASGRTPGWSRTSWWSRR